MGRTGGSGIRKADAMRLMLQRCLSDLLTWTGGAAIMSQGWCLTTGAWCCARIQSVNLTLDPLPQPPGELVFLF